jgi:hypothetical protein
MKPDWKDAPDWANWLSRDEDGGWWWYEIKPCLSMSRREWVNNGGKVEAHTGPNDIWYNSAEERPR